MTTRIKRICITRKTPRRDVTSPAKQNAIDILAPNGTLLARVEVWKRPNQDSQRAGTEVQIDVLSDPTLTKVSRVDMNSNPPFAERPPLVFSECPCPQCEDGAVDSGGFTPWGAPIEVGCPFCNGSGKVVATFYPNSG